MGRKFKQKKAKKASGGDAKGDVLSAARRMVLEGAPDRSAAFANFVNLSLQNETLLRSLLKRSRGNADGGLDGNSIDKLRDVTVRKWGEHTDAEKAAFATRQAAEWRLPEWNRVATPRAAEVKKEGEETAARDTSAAAGNETTAGATTSAAASTSAPAAKSATLSRLQTFVRSCSLGSIVSSRVNI
jgi:hypothetical protein